MGFVYELKQTSPWTQYYTENNQTYTIRQHTDYFAWGELMSLTMMCLGRFLSILSLNEIFAQSLFGHNLRRHQPFDYCEDSTLANDDPRDVKDLSIQNVLAHWIPKFIIGSMYELVTDDNGQKLGESNIHTLTCKQPDNVIAPTIARHLENYHHIKSRPTDDHGQNTFAQYRHFIEQEMQTMN